MPLLGLLRVVTVVFTVILLGRGTVHTPLEHARTDARVQPVVFHPPLSAGQSVQDCRSLSGFILLLLSSGREGILDRAPVRGTIDVDLAVVSYAVERGPARTTERVLCLYRPSSFSTAA